MNRSATVLKASRSVPNLLRLVCEPSLKRIWPGVPNDQRGDEPPPLRTPQEQWGIYPMDIAVYPEHAWHFGPVCWPGVWQTRAPR